MSRVGKKPINIPEKVQLSMNDRVLTVKGEKGTLTREIHPNVELNIESASISVSPVVDNRSNRAFQGMTRALIANMVDGVSKGYERVLELNGIGYRAEISGKNLVLHVGYSKPQEFEIPEGITAAVDKNTVIKIAGIDKEKLGLVAAKIRGVRPPEPYKGKGIKYVEERIIRKAGKTGTK